jgi:hypothetical protein
MISGRIKPRQPLSGISGLGSAEKPLSESDKRDRALSEDKIDESLEETFPASDPPSWIVTARIGSPK